MRIVDNAKVTLLDNGNYWIQYTYDTTIKSSNSNKIMNQISLISAIKIRSFIVGSQDPVTGSISFAAHPATHSTSSAARTECKRLAAMSPGKLYLFVELVGAELVPNNTVSI